MPSPSDNRGVIHDIGYQHHEGPRLGRWYIARSLYVHSLRTAFGLGRNARAKILPFGLLALGCIAALVLAIVSTQLPEPVLSFAGLVSTFTFGATAFVAVVAPELVSRDLRNNLLGLYFSRPLRRSDYALAKLAALASAVFAVFALPMLIMYLGLVLSGKDGLEGVAEQTGLLLLGVIAAVIHSALLAAVALPLASVSGRRVFATGAIIGLFLITAPIASLLAALDTGALSRLAGIIDPVTLLNGVDSWLFDEGLVNVGSYGPVYGLVTVAVTAIGTALLVRRYRKVAA